MAQAGDLKNKFEQIARDNKPEQYGGPVRWNPSGNSGGGHTGHDGELFLRT